MTNTIMGVLLKMPSDVAIPHVPSMCAFTACHSPVHVQKNELATPPPSVHTRTDPGFYPRGILLGTNRLK